MSPICFCLVSNYPIFSIQKQFLTHIFNDIIKGVHRDTLALLGPAEETPTAERAPGKSPRAPLSSRESEHRRQKLEFYISLLFHYVGAGRSNQLIEIYKMIKRPSAEKQVQKPILRIFDSLRNQGHFKVDNYEFSFLFRRVNYQRIIQLFVALLLERKVILITKDFSELSILIETLKALLYPLQWKCITISFLIPKLIDYLDAPVPYIIGISRTMWKEVSAARPLPAALRQKVGDAPRGDVRARHRAGPRAAQGPAPQRAAAVHFGAREQPAREAEGAEQVPGLAGGLLDRLHAQGQADVPQLRHLHGQQLRRLLQAGRADPARR